MARTAGTLLRGILASVVVRLAASEKLELELGRFDRVLI